MADFTSETMETRKQWDDIFKILRKTYPRIKYFTKTPFKNKEKINSFSDTKTKRLTLSRPAIQELLKEVL